MSPPATTARKAPAPRLLAAGHVTWDRTVAGELLGGSASYAAACAQRLGWESAILTAAAPDFRPAQHLPGVCCFCRPAEKTTRFQNVYDAEGERRQLVLSRSEDLVLDPLPDEWRDPDALLICPVIGEVRGALATAFSAGVIGAVAQGWLRAIDADGTVIPRDWSHPHGDLEGVHVLFLSERDASDAEELARRLLGLVPIIALTRGWRGLTLLTREARLEVPALPRREVDPTGAGDVFAAAFLLRYHETGHPLEAAAFAACAASCVVEGPGLSTLGDRGEVERRLLVRERLVEEGEDLDE